MALTKKQKLVYDFIVNYIDENGISPTQMEIQEEFGFKSLGSVQDYIRYLRNAGYIKNDSNTVRGIIPLKTQLSEDIIQIPLHGSVAAGQPIEAFEGDELIEIPKNMIRAGDHFALTISGESMIEDGILDGDTVVIKNQNWAANGETIVATIDNEATIKRFYKKNSVIELHPANSSMSPIIVREGNFEIKGILVGLLRSY